MFKDELATTLDAPSAPSNGQTFSASLPDDWEEIPLFDDPLY